MRVCSAARGPSVAWKKTGIKSVVASLTVSKMTPDAPFVVLTALTIAASVSYRGPPVSCSRASKSATMACVVSTCLDTVMHCHYHYHYQRHCHRYGNFSFYFLTCSLSLFLVLIVILTIILYFYLFLCISFSFFSSSSSSLSVLASH